MLKDSAIGRYWRTLRPLRREQFSARLVHYARSVVERRLPALAAALLPPASAAPAGITLDTPPPELLAEERVVADRWLTGSVAYHGIEGPRGDWHGRGMSRLWRYERHYHRELPALAALAATTPAGPYAGAARQLIASWLEQCPFPARDAWEPYPAARRILNWSLAAALCPDLAATLAPLLERQLGFLHDRLEHHLLGNHLLCDAAALVAGSALIVSARSERYGEQGGALLADQLDAQLLGDGGYAERSVQYHAIVLRDVLLALGLARRRGRALPAPVDAAARRMATWLARLLACGPLPWINDAAPDATPAPGEVLALARALGCIEGPWDGWLGRAFGAGPAEMPAEAPPDPPLELELAATGWSIVGAAGSVLLFDHGVIGPDEQPGHGHADALAFELRWNGQPIVTDSGVTTYELGAVRDFERSARAHATVTVDDGDADELWAAFRVGGRAKVSGGLRQRTVEGIWVLDGTARAWSGWVHRRFLIFWPGQGLVVCDQVDHAKGSEVLSRIPLDAGCRWQSPLVLAPGTELRLEILCGVLARAPHGALHPRDGWVGRGFARPEARTTVVLRANDAGCVSYALLAPGVRVTLDRTHCCFETPQGCARLPIGQAP